MTTLPKAFSPEQFAELLSDAGRAELARPVEAIDPRDAQMVPGRSACWYVFEVASRDVEAELIKRRFGVYVPECYETVIRRGREVARRVRLFPGYVFVFLWETDDNWHRVASIRGVIAGIGALPDEAIDRIRYLENCELPIVLETFEQEEVVMIKRKKRWKKTRRTVSVQDEIVRTRPWSVFDDGLQGLDSEQRNQLLRNHLLVPAPADV